MPRSRSKISAGERIRAGHRYLQRIGYVGDSREVNLLSTCTYHTLTSLAATSNSPTRGQVKIPHVTAARCRDDYPAAARLATRSAASFSRQLLPSNFSRLPRCISRSRSGVTTTTSPRSVGQSSTGRFDVSTVEDFS